MKKVLHYLWQLPQNICGLVYKAILNKKCNLHSESENFKCYLKDSRGSVTLGKYIFVYRESRNLEESILHEKGHVVQSLRLGPLYLLVIGLPSLLHCWYNDFVDCCWTDGKYHYEHFYTEDWAEDLAYEASLL